ncbi:MAG: tRNA preQ1(34) S-adenosylmethionine ribosyltransferase-isomerase QueA [Deltaproteobacteria bacterium]|nr:tRNA preQ1(34) S-adenosylmethionine ribosyltransferase-isomerase QueA [Deltaproteobacteria bacterium]
MEVALFDYDLPVERIAQYPLSQRDQSRLLLVEPRGCSFPETLFCHLSHYLSPGDLLVLNDTRVIPARLLGQKESGGQVEAFLVRDLSEAAPDEAGSDSRALWQVLFKSSKKMRKGQKLEFGTGLCGQVIEPSGSEPGLLLLTVAAGASVNAAIEKVGQVPLPPYIKRQPAGADRQTYQTVYADSAAAGAVAAPTAGLHFTRELLDTLQANGIETAFLTLHVGLGTFSPVRCRTVEEHRIHEEYFQIPETTLARICQTKARKRRVVAVGTTVTRALEFYALTGKSSGMCDIFIYPGHEFKLVDGLLTNFHLPASTLMMLVSAFAGRETIMAAYRRALALNFRFYSYGDAMLILP